MTTGATILGCEGPSLGQSEAAFFRQADPFGFILFGRNIESPDQLRRLTADLRASVGRDAFILIDQEGGRVQRMGPPHWRQWLPPLDQVSASASPTAGIRAMYLRYRMIAAELRAVGIDANCAPLADVATDATHPFLRNRCFGTDLAQVVPMARATAEGLLAGGVVPVLKHMPGHGRATSDSHKALPRVDAPLDALEALDFQAFKDLNDLPMAMTAHIVFPALDPDLPATQSRPLVRYMRQKIGFEGLLMTDDLSMQALSGTMADRAAASIAAGCDVVLHCNGDLAEMEQVVPAAGSFAPAAARRAAYALAARTVPDDADLKAIADEFDALLGNAHV